MACTWFGEICSCCCLTVLLGPAWVLLSKIYKPFAGSLYFQSAFSDTAVFGLQCENSENELRKWRKVVVMSWTHDCTIPPASWVSSQLIIRALQMGNGSGLRCVCGTLLSPQNFYLRQRIGVWKRRLLANNFDFKKLASPHATKFYKVDRRCRLILPRPCFLILPNSGFGWLRRTDLTSHATANQCQRSGRLLNETDY